MLPAFLFATMCVKWASHGGGGVPPPPSVPAPLLYSSWRYSDEHGRDGALWNNTEETTVDNTVDNTADNNDNNNDDTVHHNNRNNQIDIVIANANGFHGSPKTKTIPAADAAGSPPLLSVVGRGGGGPEDNDNNRAILRGGKTVVARASEFWTAKLGGALASVRARSPFRNRPGKRAEKERELLEKLRTMPVREVVVVNSTVLPEGVVRTAVQRSGMVGSPLGMDRVRELSKNLKRWYDRRGYVLHTVTGASLDADTATASITVEEPVVSALPVSLVFCKEMVIDHETGEPITFKKYAQKQQQANALLDRKRTGGLGSRFRGSAGGGFKIDRKNLNTTLVPTTGKTDPAKIARAMRLAPGEPFRWLDDRWAKIASSGVFSRILRASPEPATDGGVCLQIHAVEPPPRHLEYGIGKSVWTDSWEGEVDFDWRNVFGGGESVGVMVRRGTKDSSPSVRLRYGDDRFGLEGGYDLEAFSDFLGDTASDATDPPGTETGTETGDGENGTGDSLLSRRGATLRLRNPIGPGTVTHSAASASLERTSTTTGELENIGSATITLGPFRTLLPMDARSSVTTTITGGTRVTGKADETSGPLAAAAPKAEPGFLPYSSASATTRQILPIAVSSSFGDNDGNKTPPPPITLALQHTLSLSTPNLPRHEARALGNSARIRGAKPDGGGACSVARGTTEIRVPVAAPVVGTGTVVLFGDWFCLRKDADTPFCAKSSIGIGIRKNVQGLPLKYDVSYSSEGKIKTMFGLGPDFDA